MAFRVQGRASGLVELACEHGVGHPSKPLTGARWQDWMGVHGCDGCCGLPAFSESEREIVANREEQRARLAREAAEHG